MKLIACLACLAYVAGVVFALSLCKAAARGDRR